MTTFEHLDAAQARKHRDLVEDIFRRSYVDAIAAGGVFESPAEFMRRFDAYSRSDESGFAYILARVDGEPAGQIWGWPLRPNAAWWGGFHADGGVDADEFITETGARTFALSEIMVVADYAGQGVAKAMHDELLDSRPESRATLLVEPDNARAYGRYLQWGWRKAGWLRPHWDDAPQLDVLIRDLNN